MRGHANRVSFCDALGMEPGHRKTRKVYDRDGDAHFLTFSSCRRLPLLNKDRTRQWMIDAIALSRSKHSFDWWAWVIVSEHVHLVLWPHSKVRISSILTTMKQSVSRRAILWLKENSPGFLEQLLDRQPNGKESYRFWQRGGGDDRNLRSTRDIREKILYAHQNSVKRRLVDSPELWKWSSAKGWLTGSETPISLDRNSVPVLSHLDDEIRSKLLE